MVIHPNVYKNIAVCNFFGSNYYGLSEKEISRPGSIDDAIKNRGMIDCETNENLFLALAALLSVLPDEITDDGDVYRNMVFHLKGKYIIQYPRLTTLWPSLLSVEAVNIIDACVEMIIKLHELKML